MNNERGNVLFLILIAAALFAALTYAVIHSTRTNAGSVDQEQVKLKAAKILQFTASLRLAAQRIRIDGLAVEKIQLHEPGEQTKPCTPDPACAFGSPGGGAIEIDLGADSDLDQDGNVWKYADYNDGETVYQSGTELPELVVSRTFKFNKAGKDMCTALNKGLGLGGNGDIPAIDGSNESLATYPAAPGQGAACLRHNTDYYVFYAALLEN